MKNKGIKIIFSFIFFLLLLSFNTNVNGEALKHSRLYIRRTYERGDVRNLIPAGSFKTKMVDLENGEKITRNTEKDVIKACLDEANRNPKNSYCGEPILQKGRDTYIAGTLEPRYIWKDGKCFDQKNNKDIKGYCHDGTDVIANARSPESCNYNWIEPKKVDCVEMGKKEKICRLDGEVFIPTEDKPCSTTTTTKDQWTIELYTKSTTAKIHNNKIFQFSVVRYDKDGKPVLNPAYCINPGRIGPSLDKTGNLYCEQGSFNLKNCSKNLSESYYCGLGEILYRTMNPIWDEKSAEVDDEDEDGKIVKAVVSYLTLKPLTDDKGQPVYDYGQIVTALRMWTAWYQSDRLNTFKELSDVDGLGMETVLTESGGRTDEPVYKTTADYVVSAGYRGGYCKDVGVNILCAQDGDKVEREKIKETINLFLFAFNMFSGSSNAPFMGGMFDDDGVKKFIGEKKVESVVEGTEVTFIAKTTNIVNEGNFKCSFDRYGKADKEKSIYIDANGKEEIIEVKLNPACNVYCDPTDEKGSECTKNETHYIIQDDQAVPVDDVDVEIVCKGKQTCDLIISFEASCEQSHPETQEKFEALKYRLVTYSQPKLSEKTLSFGEIRQYADCADPTKYQVMMTTPFADLAWDFSTVGKVIERQYYTGKEWVEYHPIEIIPWVEFSSGPATVWCKKCDENKCPPEAFINRVPITKNNNSKITRETTDKNIITNFKCGGTYYGKEEISSTDKDPNISCILNACNPDDKKRYSISDDVGANKTICNIYCREEAKFYLSTKAKSYAGMQFSYDIKNTFNDKKLFENIPQKITNVVSLRKQCVSEIYYNKESEFGTKYSDKLNKLSNSDIIAIRDCNFLEEGENSLYSKIKKKFECSDSNPEACVKLSAEYDNKIIEEYGRMEKPEPEIYKKWCSGKDCLTFDKGKINENPSICAKGDCQSKCANGKDCKSEEDVPINDYAELDINMQTYFYVPNKYISVPYTGETKIKDDKDDSVSSTENTNILNDYVYPISDLETKFGKNSGYEIKYKFTNLFMNMNSLYSNEFDYSCSFDVYNITNKYDCAIAIDNNKQLDVSNCKNSCFEMKNGVPVISDECSSFDIRDKKNYGFIYRNIDLANPFPSEDGDDDLKRDSGLNWSIENDAARDAIDEIKLSAEEIFTNPDYLEYSYTITPDGIQRIREYNADAIKDGGYRNNTIDGCETNSVYGYKNCKSRFLNDIIKNWGNDVIVNKEVRGE